MSSYLDAALADADRTYATAKAAGRSIPSRLAGSTATGLGVHQVSLGRAAEQYAHYRGWVYVAVKTIAAKIAGQPVCVGRVGSSPKPGRKLYLPGFAKSLDLLVEPLPSHRFLEAIQNPNELQVQWSLLFSTAASLMICGRSLWWYNDADGEPQIWPLPATWFEPADDMRRGWTVRPPGFPESFNIPAQDAVLFSLPDPSSPFSLGTSPLQAMAKAVATDEEIQNAQFRAFQNGPLPQFAFRVGKLPGMVPGEPGDKIVLEPEQRIELISAIKRLYSGTNRAAEPLILDGMIEGVDRISSTNAEMDFLQSGDMTKSRILQAYGLNPIIAGEIENANRASAAVAGQLFCEHTLGPIVELISQSLTRFACRRFASPKEKLLVWLEECRANDPEQRLSEWKTALSAGIVTPNEYRTAILNLDAMAGGDQPRDVLGNPLSN